MRAKRYENGTYIYKGYILRNYGYYPEDKCIWWEAENMETGCGDYHEHTKKELMRRIDLEESNGK